MDDRFTDRFTLETPELAAAAKWLGCSLAAVQAVTEVESSGSGFLGNGKVKLLFEGHVFWKYTKGRFEHSHPTLCYRKWTKSPTGSMCLSFLPRR